MTDPPSAAAAPAHSFTRAELLDHVWSTPLKHLAARWGISGNGLAKICDRLLIPHPPRGHWSRDGGGAAPRPPLPPGPFADDLRVTISGQRAESRRERTRKPLGERRDEIVRAAGELIRRAGLNGVTMKAVAREVGVSEALVYTYFSSVTDLLVFMARAEIEAVSAAQQREMAALTDYAARARASARGYLGYVAERGAVLQTLLRSPAVRGALSEEHQARREWSARSMATHIAAGYDLDLEMAAAGTQFLRAVPLRAGRLLGEGKVDLDTAERLTRLIADGGRQALIAAARRGVA